MLEHNGAPEAPLVQERTRRFPRWAALALVAACIAVVLGVVVGVKVAHSGHDETTTSSTGQNASSTSQSTAAPATTSAGKPLGAAVVAGDSLLRQGKLREAAAKYQEALQADPRNDVTRTRLGIAYYLMPRSLELARQQFEMALESNAKNVQALSFLGLVRSGLTYDQGSKDYGAAEDVLQQALELNPDNAQAKAFLGRTLTAAGEGARGSELVENAARAATEDAFVQMTLGWVYGVRSQWAAAVPYDRRGVALQPNFAQFQLQLAEALREIKLWDEAISYARTALALGQGFDAAAYQSMGHTMWKRGDTTGAKDSFRRAIEKDNTDDYSYWGLGALLYDQGDYKGALPDLERAVKLEPANAGYHSWLGACYKALQQWDKARKELTTALSLDPARADAKKYLNELEAAGH